MEALLELIFGNFFIVLLIIFGILGFLRDNSAKQKEEEQRRRRTGQQRSPQSSQPSYSSQEDTHTGSRSTLEKARESISSSTIAEQQQEQLDKLASQFNTKKSEVMSDMQEEFSDTKSVLREFNRDLSKEQKQIKKGVSESLKGKGLINGIIMAEVLGPPRATKPYRSVISERKNR
jgi:vacuolar-type H+-ATPase subunit I/STV1